MPQSPHRRCETFGVTVYEVTGDRSREQHLEGLQSFDTSLIYGMAIL